MNIVYRIQSKQDRTRGAYSSLTRSESCLDVVNRMCCKLIMKRPTPPNDNGINRHTEPNEHCGFNSAADLLRWFRGFIPDLLRVGYEIVALQDVTITAVGEYQVLFKFNT